MIGTAFFIFILPIGYICDKIHTLRCLKERGLMSNQNPKPYVFVSYAHADSDRVLPAVKALRNSGVNVWYDDGIVAGSEWPEFIAEKVVSCHKFILFVSNAYIVSQNCKRELNFAISRKKDILTIFLEDVHLSPGMEMQLGTYQAINRNRFPSDSELFASLCREPFFNECRFTDGANTYSQPNFVDNKANVKTRENFSYPKNVKKPKSKNVAMLLSLFLGSIGAQHFYLGRNNSDYVKGVACILFCWAYVPSVLGIITFIKLLLMKDSEFDLKYNK